MPRLVERPLTVLRVKALSKPGHYGDGSGLYLQINPKGYKCWVLRYTLGGRVREMGLGSLRDVTLAQARDATQEARALVRQLIDPIDERKKRKAELTHHGVIRRVHFIDALDKYLRYRDLKGKNAISVENPIRTYIVPVLGRLPVADITPKHVYGALTTTAKNGKALWDLAIGDRTLPNLTGLFTYAIAQGWRENTINPADREQLKIVGLKAQKREVAHFVACPYARIPECWEKLQAHTDTSMMALRWAILNASRPKEARMLRWSWIDTPDRIVTIPKTEMKGNREHRIPYGDAAAALLDEMRAVRTCDWVFPNNQDKPYSADLFAMLARRVMPDVPGITSHGFRSSFADWANERTVFEPDMIEVALAHQVGNTVAQAYRRGDLLAKRRTMMDAWADYCQGRGTNPKYRSEFIAVARG